MTTPVEFTREQMEGHLILNDWVPINVSRGGAMKLGSIIYIFMANGTWGPSGGNVTKVGLQSQQGLNLTDLQLQERLAHNAWDAMDEDDFWQLAQACMRMDAPPPKPLPYARSLVWRK